jgi:hypothetical protein
MSTPVRAGHGNTALQFGMGGFGQTSSFNMPPGNHGASAVELENLIFGLTAGINELENAVTADDGPPITLEGIQSKNKIQLKAWLTTNTDQSVKNLVSCFPDVLGLLGMAGRFVKDDMNSLELESKAVKAGYGSVNHFLISKSFTLPLPAIFGTEKEGGAGDAIILPKFKTFKSCDPQLSFIGGLIEIKAKVKLEVESTLAHINHNLTGAARSVAKACVTDAEKSIREILGWMSATYHMLSKAGGNTSPSENRNYVSHAVRGIFAHLQQARSTGYGTKEVANMIWGCLRGKAAADEMLNILFRKHPVVATVLKDHLQHSAIMLDEFDRNMKKTTDNITKISRDVELAKSTADRALQKAGKG